MLADQKAARRSPRCSSGRRLVSLTMGPCVGDQWERFLQRHIHDGEGAKAAVLAWFGYHALIASPTQSASVHAIQSQRNVPRSCNWPGGASTYSGVKTYCRAHVKVETEEDPDCGVLMRNPHFRHGKAEDGVIGYLSIGRVSLAAPHSDC